MADASGKIIIGNTVTTPPAIVQSLFRETHPAVIVKDKSIHTEHGVIHYPFWFGGVASAVSTTCTQPLGVATVRLQTQHHAMDAHGMTNIFRQIWRSEGTHGL